MSMLYACEINLCMVHVAMKTQRSLEAQTVTNIELLEYELTTYTGTVYILRHVHVHELTCTCTCTLRNYLSGLLLSWVVADGWREPLLVLLLGKESQTVLTVVAAAVVYGGDSCKVRLGKWWLLLRL